MPPPPVLIEVDRVYTNRAGFRRKVIAIQGGAIHWRVVDHRATRLRRAMENISLRATFLNWLRRKRQARRPSPEERSIRHLQSLMPRLSPAAQARAQRTIAHLQRQLQRSSPSAIPRAGQG